MSRYSVYLEVGQDGQCFAHVLELPGCIARAKTREASIMDVPGAISAYHAWLRRHGEAAPPDDEPTEFEIEDEEAGFGAFEPDDAAALFPPDRIAVDDQEMARYFRLMEHARSDLLALVEDLTTETLDWEAPYLSAMGLPEPRLHTIRGLLRHIGNSEKWYTSRVVPRETLPPGWSADDSVPVLEYLSVVRHSAMKRLWQIDEQERSAVHHPSYWTGHPEEAWTLRKALRRFLEHEFEHTTQIRERLSLYRSALLARLAAERSGLMEQLLGVDESPLTEAPIVGSWTAKDLLAHLASWDRWMHQTMRAMVAGHAPDFSALEDFDASNTAFLEPWRSSSLGEVLSEVRGARREWIAWLEGLPEDAFFRRRSHAGRTWSNFRVPLRVIWEHDAEHSEQIASWRRGLVEQSGDGCRPVLDAALAAARAELLAAAALVPPEARSSHGVCGEWTLKELFGHQADWEWVGADGLREMAAGRTPQLADLDDIDGWNQAHVESRQGQSWTEVRKNMVAAREALLSALQGVENDVLSQKFEFPWGGSGSVFDWAAIFVGHDRDHARELEPSGAQRA
ncbi:type II toxin-antitoxin system HicB family antitoxin [Chloroflexota bacterium]